LYSHAAVPGRVSIHSGVFPAHREIIHAKTKKLQIFTKELFALRLFLLDFTEMTARPENGIDFSAKKC
jgi:hypothetical protein